jgi:hypothetical protein
MMRQISKTIQIAVDGKPVTFRLRKLDALSGACLLRMLARGNDGEHVDLSEMLFEALTDEELRRLMVVCLEHVDVLLDAGYQPVMQMGEWSWGEMQYDPGNALQLTMKEIMWTLDGFFVESGSNSEDGPRNI